MHKNLKENIHSNQRDFLPVSSSKGTKNVMIAYDCETNTIIARRLKTKSEIEQLNQIKILCKCLNIRESQQKMRIINNEYLKTVRLHHYSKKNWFYHKCTEKIELRNLYAYEPSSALARNSLSISSYVSMVQISLLTAVEFILLRP